LGEQRRHFKQSLGIATLRQMLGHLLDDRDRQLRQPGARSAHVGGSSDIGRVA